jgi:hypothetical protein
MKNNKEVLFKMLIQGQQFNLKRNKLGFLNPSILQTVKTIISQI